MIIVEGADNCGKSRLVEQLVALDPGLRILHRDRYKPNMRETIGDSYLKALVPPAGRRLAHACSIADRFFASECIYGRLFRGGCRMSANEHYTIKAWLLSYGAFVIHCDPPDHRIVENWSERDQLYKQDPLLIARAYRNNLTKIFHPLTIYKYDWTSDDAEAVRFGLTDLHHQVLEKYQYHLDSWSVETCTGGTG